MNDVVIYMIVGMLGLVVLAIILQSPVWGLIFTINSLVFYTFTFLPGQFDFTSLTGILGGLTLASYLFQHSEFKQYQRGRKKITPYTDKHLYVLAALLAVEILIWDSLVPIHLDRLFIFTYIQLLLLIWLAEKIIDTPEKLETLMKVFIAVNLVALASSLRNFDFFAGDAAANRLRGLAGNANEFSIYVGVSILFLFYFFDRTANRFWKMILLALGLFLFVPVLFSGSRGGFLFLVLVLAYQTRRFRRGGLFFVGGLILLGLFSSITFASDYIDRVLAIPTDLMTQSDTIGLRFNLWLYAIELWKTSPFWGIGTGMYLVRSIDSPVLQGRRMLQAHNAYVTYLVENGVFGLLLFLLILAKSVLNYEKAARFYKSLNIQLNKLAITWQSVFLLYAFNGLKGNLNTSKIFWLSFGISIVFARWVAEGVQTPKKEAASVTPQYSLSISKPHQ